MIVVFGANGKTGIEVVKEAKRRGLEVRPIAKNDHDTHRLETVVDVNEIVFADADHPDAIISAIQGATCIVSCIDSRTAGFGAPEYSPEAGANIINVASVNGIIPGDFQGIYSITKSSVIAMTKAFAKECAPQGIRVNALLPGLTDTKFASALTKNDAIMKQALMHIPMKRSAVPEEMAGTVLYLASEASSYTRKRNKHPNPRAYLLDPD